MKFDEVLASMPPVDYEDLDTAWSNLDKVIASDDFSENDRAGFCSGVLIGMRFALAAVQKDGEQLTGLHLITRMSEWEAKGWL